MNDILRSHGDQVVGLFDNDPSVSSVLQGVPLLGGMQKFEEWIKQREGSVKDLAAAVAIGGSRGHQRLSILSTLSDYGLDTPSIMHQTSTVSSDATIGAGCQLLANSVVGPLVKMGMACILNHGAIVDHECTLGSGVHLGPSATICGCVTVGENVFLGSGSVILPRLRIGDDCIIGAGAVVTKNVSAGTVVIGNPARAFGAVGT